MATSWEKIETQAMTYIKNDLSLDWDMKNRLAVFYNRMAAYMSWSIGMFDRPPEVENLFVGMTEPQFEDMDYYVSSDMSSPTTIESEITGYTICSCGIVTENSYGEVEYFPLDCIYDSSTGDVVINADISAGQTISLNFYKSGSFATELSKDEIKILAYGIYAAWEHRFDNDALERTSKIRDSSFTTISEASQTNANTSRQKEVMQELWGMMRQYEMNKAYRKVVTR